MEKRRETRQLDKGDVVELSLQVKAEVTAKAQPTSNEAFAGLQIKPMPCGAECGKACGCQYRAFESAETPVLVTLKANQRVSFLGNLAELLKAQEAMKSRIAVLEASYGNGEKESPVDDGYGGTIE